MKEWLKISLQLSLYGFFDGIHPSSHFFYQILTEFREANPEYVTNTFIPQQTYFAVATSILALLLTDMTRYKPVILVGAVAAIAASSVLRWTTGLDFLLVTTLMLSISSASSVAYYTYIYAKVGRDRYQKATSNTRSASLIGRCCGAVLGQLLMIYKVIPVQDLIYISITTRVIGLLVAISLPRVTTSMYFYQAKPQQALESPQNLPSNEVDKKSGIGEITDGRKGDSDSSAHDQDQELVKFSWSNAKALLWIHFKSAYSNKTVRLWSFWWAISLAGFNMFYGYNQPLWGYMEPDRENVYNGFAEMGLTLCGAIGAQLAGLLNQPFIEKWVIWVVSVCSAILAVLIYLTGHTPVMVSYGIYIITGGTFYFMITITYAIVAKNLMQDSFALIFGLNNWMAVMFRMLYAFIVTSDNVFVLNPVEQYTVYSGYFVVLAVIFGSYGGYKVIRGQPLRRVSNTRINN